MPKRFALSEYVVIRLLVKVTTAVSLIGLLAPGASHATFPGGNGKIAFAANERLYTVNANGTSPTPVPTTSCEGLEPDWHPDGGQLGFIERCGPSGTFDLSVVNVDGTGLRKLYASNTDDAQIDWSRDGSKFLFISYINGNREIYLSDAAATQVINLTNNPARDEWPAWSPDGKRIAFASDRTGNFEIYTMKLNGNGLTNLTNNPADDGSSGALGGPSWSPDGRQIAFDSVRTGSPEIFSMDSCGGNVSQLTDGGVNQQPAWSPDGRLIAFTSDRNGTRDLFLMASDGTSETPLITLPSFDERPDWQVVPRSKSDDGDHGKGRKC
jgi:Tol biopolymer transport system component